MTTHRGINFSSIAGEGLNGFPGFLIALFFLLFPLGGLIGLLVWALGSALGLDWDRWPIPRSLLALDGLVGLLLLIAAASAVYLFSQWRDKRLSARIREELHKLNEGTDRGVAVPATDDEVTEFARTWNGKLGFEDFRAEELRAAAQVPSMSSQDQIVAALALVFIAAAISVLVSTLYDLWVAIAAGLGALSVGVGVSLAYQGRRVRRIASTAEREMEKRR